MTRRQRRRHGRPTCGNCGRPVVWLRRAMAAPGSSAWRTFDPKPVDGRTHHGPPACPVENGRLAWRFRELVEELMVRRECSQADAEDEARDMPWYVPHRCPQDAPTAATPGQEA